MENLIRITRQILDDRYPTASVILLAGSLLRGEGTPYSDLDLVVIFDQLPHAWRESFDFQGYPVEAFVHDPETLNYFLFESNRSSNTPAMARMVLEGIEVPGPTEISQSLKRIASELIASGPPNISDEDERKLRYTITNLIDDIRQPRSREELVASGAELYGALANYYFRTNGLWPAVNKSIPRTFGKAGPDLYSRFCEGFDQLFADGRSDRVITIATIAKTLKSKSQELSYARNLSYAVIKKKGKVVAKVGGPMDHPLTAIDIGLFPLLGSKTKQLIISQTVPRGGRHWIVEVAANPKVLFDSGDYEVGREEVWAVDIEGDGVLEIKLFVTSFYGAFNQLSVASTPLPTVVFRYDRQAGRYLPANHRYRDHLIEGIETEIRNLPSEISPLPSSAGERFLASRLNVLLRFLYAGKEKEGWEFFDKSYTQPDADKIKAIIKEDLKKAPAYKFIRKRSSI